jgi:dihydrofolate synthase/folylpolyglutamate synthase
MPKMMRDYNRQLEWLFNQFPAFQKIGSTAYKPTLENTNKLIDLFDIDLTAMRFVHVAGTNGKGTTCSILASYFTEAGLKTGLFTSPHIHDFRERIRVNGKLVDMNFVQEFIQKVRAIDFEFSPSFFEISWVMALKHFQTVGCDIIVVETGLGGRLDATNVISPLISVITNIGLDHTAILGNTLPEIAFEKAGIIKGNIPVVIGYRQKETTTTFEQVSKNRNAALYFVEQLPDATTFDLNKATAKKTLELLSTKVVPFEKNLFNRSIVNLTNHTGIRGRFQVLNESPLLIADAAHNFDGILRLISDVKVKYPNRKVHAVYGASNDKDLLKLLSLFPSDWSYYFTTFKNQRSYTVDELTQLGQKSNLEIHYFDSPQSAMIKAQSVQNKEDIILVFGSFFLLEEII